MNRWKLFLPILVSIVLKTAPVERRSQVPLHLLQQALADQGVQKDFEELQGMMANLIYRKWVKGVLTESCALYVHIRHKESKLLSLKAHVLKRNNKKTLYMLATLWSVGPCKKYNMGCFWDQHGKPTFWSVCLKFIVVCFKHHYTRVAISIHAVWKNPLNKFCKRSYISSFWSCWFSKMQPITLIYLSNNFFTPD